MHDLQSTAVNAPRQDFGMPAEVDILLEDLLNVLWTARQAGRAWVGDFCDERIRISHDLYEVLCAARATAL